MKRTRVRSIWFGLDAIKGPRTDGFRSTGV
jgi:hypothetical protein